MADESGEIVKLDAGAAKHAPGMTRREAMLELLRVGGVAAGAAGLGVWLSERSSRPVPEQAAQARRDHRVAADAAWPQMTVVQGGEPRALAAQAIEILAEWAGSSASRTWWC